MKKMSAIELRTTTDGKEVLSRTRGDFVVLFALSAIVFHSVFSIAVFIAAPDLLRSPVVWVLWAFVVVVSAAGIVVGRYVASVRSLG